MDAMGAEVLRRQLKHHFLLDVAIYSDLPRSQAWLWDAAIFAGCRAPFVWLVDISPSPEIADPTAGLSPKSLERALALLESTTDAVALSLRPSSGCAWGETFLKATSDGGLLCTPGPTHWSGLIYARDRLKQIMPYVPGSSKDSLWNEAAKASGKGLIYLPKL